MDQFIKYVGLDTQNDTIAIAVIVGGKPRYYGEIANTPSLIPSKPGGRFKTHISTQSRPSEGTHYCELAAITLIQRKAGYGGVSTDYPHGTCC